MKLKSFKVEKLFNTFDHSITINNNTGITIVIGENGIGKTVILEMIEAIFNKRFFYLQQIVFNKIILEFTDGVRWVINKEIREEIPTLTLIPFESNSDKSSIKKPLVLFKANREEISHLNLSRFSSPYLRRIGPETWEDRRTGIIFSREELMLRFGDEGPDLFYRESQFPDWFNSRIENNNVSLIKTQRLLFIDDRERERERDRSIPIKTVEKYSTELSKLIKSHLAQSTELSSKLDRTYPNRLIKRISQAGSVETSSISEDLSKLEKKRELLDKVGLIEIDKESSLLYIDDRQNETLKYVLKLYVEDSFEKLKIFDNLSSKIEILLDIINKRFKHKKLFIEKEKGFLFKSTIIKDSTGKQNEIPVDKLSSGEQNELVLFYELLFKSKDDSLILIDEPEISLHISWQNSFIEDLKEIARLNDLEILIATHSPDIISNNWDLRVELKGIE